jgi:hypothetical protein
MKTVIVNTPLVRVFQTVKGYEMLITCKDGSIIEHELFPNNLEGMVSAISLSAEICAGKFYLSRVVQTTDYTEKRALEFKKKGKL